MLHILCEGSILNLMDSFQSLIRAVIWNILKFASILQPLNKHEADKKKKLGFFFFFFENILITKGDHDNKINSLRFYVCAFIQSG